jgi:hypothetical protein
MYYTGHQTVENRNAATPCTTMYNTGNPFPKSQRTKVETKAKHTGQCKRNMKKPKMNQKGTRHHRV